MPGERSKTSKQVKKSESSEWLPVVVAYLLEDCRGQPRTNRRPLTLPHTHSGWLALASFGRCDMPNVQRVWGHATWADRRTRNTWQNFRHDRVRSVHRLSYGDIGGCMQLEKQPWRERTSSRFSTASTAAYISEGIDLGICRSSVMPRRKTGRPWRLRSKTQSSLLYCMTEGSYAGGLLYG